tara:strand:+ start:674 stop:874 length:201 start_codon:yes stop_codon:yes gene_type:complete
MLSPLQIERVLKHCEKVNKQHTEMDLAGDEGPLYFEFMKNQGWCEALRFVLESDTMSIRNKELEDE